MLAYRRHVVVVAGIGAVLFAPLALVQADAGAAIHEGLEAGGGRRAGAVLLWLAVGLFVLGSALCAGLLEKVVGREFGHEDEPLRRAVRSLPLQRLVAEDVVVALLVSGATLLGALPGLVALTLTCLAGPLVVIEGRTARAALSRSITLTSRRFWMVLLLVAVPLCLEHQLLHALAAWVALPLWALWALHAVAALTVVVPVILVEVTLAHLLTGAAPTSPLHP